MGVDTGVRDTGTVDAGPRDDTGVPPGDGGPRDTGVPPGDGGLRDTGVPPGDTGVPTDGGPSCAGVDCSAMDDECNVGTCNPATGLCGATPRADGTTCDDGAACTDGDSCTAGACVPGAAADCSAMTNGCNVGTCDATTGACMAVPVADGMTCDDGNVCTGAGMCTAGTCGGAVATDCSAMTNACNVGMCDPTTGGCVAMPLATGSACSDGNLCTTGEVCTTGTCGGGVAPDCSASANMCNTGACDPTTGACMAVPVADGLACSDTNACTTADSCVAGACTGTATVVTGDTCATAITLDGSVGMRTVMGTSSCADNTSTGSCAGGGVDVIYNMTLPGPRRVALTTVAPTAYDTVLYARTSCADTATQLACNDDDVGLLSRIDTSFQAGSNFVYVDSFTTTSGAFSMNVAVQAPEACASAPRLTLPAVRTTTEFTGSTTGAIDDFQSSCGGSATSPDHIFEFVVATRSRLRFQTLATAGQYDTVLHIRRGPCAAGADTVASAVACNDDSGGTALSTITQTFDAGTYYLVVDGFSTGRSGNYRVQVENIALGSTVLIGHDFFARQADADQILGNAVQLTPEPGNIEILSYTQYADLSAGGEVELARAAINAELTAAARTATFTTLADSTMLATALTASVDVLLVNEQELGTDALLTAVGTAWNAQLQAFLDRGGIIIVLDHLDAAWRVVNGPGLFTITGITNVTDALLTVTTPASRLATGVTATYTAPNGSASYTGLVGGTTIVRAAVGAPVVQHLPR